MIPFSPALDLFPLLAAILAALACGLLGNFLVLRRLSLMGDAISHSVLPGLVIAFLVTSSRSAPAMLIGAALAGLLTVLLVEIVKRFGRVEPGAAMGVVFSILFALGVLLIEQGELRHLDLDADCVLYGQLETLVWYGAPGTLAGVFTPDALAAVPRQVWTLAAAAAAALLFVLAFFKELRIAAFDPELANTQGYSATLMHALLMVLVAAAAVASFEAVGSILVIAMLVCPAATARLLTDRLGTQVVLSAALATAGGAGGYIAAATVPAWFGYDSVNAAGSMAVVAGILLVLAITLAPRHGLVALALRRRALALDTAREDILGMLYRAHEAGEPGVARSALSGALKGRPAARAFAEAERAGFIERDAERTRLTTAGQQAAAQLVRRHRLWELYLVEQAGFAPDHVHEAAEQLEHLDPAPPVGPATDPHGRAIPPESPTPNAQGPNHPTDSHS